MIVDIGGVTLHEFDVAATDALLCLEASWFATLLRREARGPLRAQAIAFFVLLALSSALGVIFHAFFPEKVASRGGFAVWMATGVAIGLTTAVLWAIDARLLGEGRLARGLRALILPYLIVFLAVLFFVSHGFPTIIAFYAPAIVLLALLAVLGYRRERSRPWRDLLLGTGLSFVAAAVQVAKLGLHPVYFNFNALYHLIQGIALLFLFLALRGLMRARG